MSSATLRSGYAFGHSNRNPGREPEIVIAPVGADGRGEDVERATFVGLSWIDGAKCATFRVTFTNRRVRYYSQIHDYAQSGL